MAKKKQEQPEAQADLEAKFNLDKKDDKSSGKKPVLYKEKKDFDMDKYKKLRTSKVEYKPDSFIPMSAAFQEVTGFPGFPQGFIHMIYGASDVGKTTAILECAVGAQKKGVLPVFVITEKKWSWERAITMGVDPDNCLFRDDFMFIEEAIDFINAVLEDQKKGDLPRDIIFLWDAVGSTPSRAEWEAQEEHEIAVQKAMEAEEDLSELKKGSGGMMNAARVLRERINRVVQHKITATRNVDFPYFATMLLVNHGYISPNPTGPASLVAYGGQALKYACTFQIRQGKVSGAPKRHTATKNGVDITWGLEVPFILEKNHMNGISRQGELIVTPHGYISATKESIEKYKKEHRDEWDKDFERYYVQPSDQEPEEGNE